MAFLVELVQFMHPIYAQNDDIGIPGLMQYANKLSQSYIIIMPNVTQDIKLKYQTANYFVGNYSYNLMSAN